MTQFFFPFSRFHNSVVSVLEARGQNYEPVCSLIIKEDFSGYHAFAASPNLDGPLPP